MDWKSIITDIQAAGYSQPHIAAICGCGQATINDLLSGKTENPHYELGETLKALHAEIPRDAPSEKARA